MGWDGAVALLCLLQFRYLGYHIHCMSPVSFGIVYRRETTSRGLCNVERKTCIGLHPIKCKMLYEDFTSYCKTLV